MTPAQRFAKQHGQIIRSKTKLFQTLFSYCDIAGIKLDINDVKSGNCTETIKLMAIFFQGTVKEDIEKSKNFDELLNAIGSEENLKKAVRMYSFTHPSNQAYYPTTHKSVHAIYIPSGGQN